MPDYTAHMKTVMLSFMWWETKSSQSGRVFLTSIIHRQWNCFCPATAHAAVVHIINLFVSLMAWRHCQALHVMIHRDMVELGPRLPRANSHFHGPSQLTTRVGYKLNTSILAWRLYCRPESAQYVVPTLRRFRWPVSVTDWLGPRV